MNASLKAALEDARAAWRSTGDAAALVACIPYAAWLGLRISRTADGMPVFHLPFRDALIGNYKLPALHGGVTAGFAENAATLHLLLVQEEPRIPKTVDFSIDYLQSAHAADLQAECTVERLGHRVAQVQVRVTQGDGEQAPPRIIALARMHFILYGPEP